MHIFGRRDQATRLTSVPLIGHALHVCATGMGASCAAVPVCVGPNPTWPGSLGRQATWERCFEISRRSSIPAAAQRRRRGGGGEGANGDSGIFTPLAANCSDVHARNPKHATNDQEGLDQHQRRRARNGGSRCTHVQDRRGKDRRRERQAALCSPSGAKGHRDGEQQQESSAPKVDGGGIGVASRHCRREPYVVTKVATGNSSDTVNDAGGRRRGTGVTSSGDAADEVERRCDSR
jgi:hypothetical protein